MDALAALDRPPIRGFVEVSLFALAVRLLFLAVWAHAYPLTLDGAEVEMVARNLYAGRGFSSSFDLRTAPTAWIAPLVPVVWWGILQAVHGSLSAAVWGIVLVQALVSAVSTGTYWLIAREVVRHMDGRAERLCTVIAVVSALWLESLRFLVDTWYFVWQELGVAWLVLTGMRWCDRPSPGRAVALGLTTGIVALINPLPLPIAAVALALPVLQATRKGGGARRAWARARLALLGGGLALVIVLPWTIRNYRVFGTLVPIRSNFGVELLQGNNSAGSVRQTRDALHPALVAAERDRLHALGEVAYSREAGARALEYMWAHPAVTIQRVALRGYVYWIGDLTDRWSWYETRKYWHARGRTIAVVTFFASGIVPLLIIFAVGVRNRHFAALPHRRLLGAVLLFLPLPHYVTVSGPAYAQAIHPWLMFLAVFALWKEGWLADPPASAGRRSKDRLRDVHAHEHMRHVHRL